ncbi:hypothetical protein ZIOFF_056050 [Zingiber officinale]|uniref:Protein kinase domain-containing protein n=1 Tax=Zingiber officinale TaxID=94328 RepID=A0A8J5FFU8_ZINOF|nr:hypothetical protein ZIOFF_056050 [Zingiber officinale]
MESGTSKSKVKRHVGKYELRRTIGEGTFAKVRFAMNIETGEPVAIKILDKEKVLKHKLVEQLPHTPINISLAGDKPQGVHNVQDKSCHSPLSKKVSLLGDEPSEVHNGQDKPRHSCLSKNVSLAGDELAGVHNAQDKPSHSLLSKLAGYKPSHSLFSETVPGDKPSHSLLTMQAHLRPFITCRQKFLGIDITIRALFGMKIYAFCCCIDIQSIGNQYFHLLPFAQYVTQSIRVA